jgi:chromosome segregation ATPase
MPDDEPANNKNDLEANPKIEETRTTIDALLELLRSRGKSELNSIAIALNMDSRIIESWAKVLENGNLVHITYEVGRMYLEPITIPVDEQQDTKVKTNITKFILEEDLAVERISLDKFSKNIDELSNSIGKMEKIYKTKMPDVQGALADIDKAYAPIEEKKRAMDRLKDQADKDFEEINKNAETLYTKIGGLSPKQIETDVNEQLDKLNKVVDKIKEAQNSLSEIEKTQSDFFKTIKSDTDRQIQELKKQLSDSQLNTEQNLKANASELKELMKGVSGQLNDAKQVSKEMDNFKKVFEGSRRDLDFLKTQFTDKYEKLKTGMNADSEAVESQSQKVEALVNSTKESFGDIAKFDENMKSWRKNVDDMSKELINTRNDIIKLTNQLNSLDTSKDSLEGKVKDINSLSAEVDKTKEKTSRIKKIIKSTTDEINRMVDDKGN